jgi:hypothetical protein
VAGGTKAEAAAEAEVAKAAAPRRITNSSRTAILPLMIHAKENVTLGVVVDVAAVAVAVAAVEAVVTTTVVMAPVAGAFLKPRWRYIFFLALDSARAAPRVRVVRCRR